MSRARSCLSWLADVAAWIVAGRCPLHIDCPDRTETDPAGLDPLHLGRRKDLGRHIGPGLALVRTGTGPGHTETDLVDLDPVHPARLKDLGRHTGTDLAVLRIGTGLAVPRIGTGLAVRRIEKEPAGQGSGLHIESRVVGLVLV